MGLLVSYPFSFTHVMACHACGWHGSLGLKNYNLGPFLYGTGSSNLVENRSGENKILNLSQMSVGFLSTNFSDIPSLIICARHTEAGNACI